MTAAANPGSWSVVPHGKEWGITSTDMDGQVIDFERKEQAEMAERLLREGGVPDWDNAFITFEELRDELDYQTLVVKCPKCERLMMTCQMFDDNAECITCHS